MRRGGVRCVEMHPWYGQAGNDVEAFDWLAFSQRRMMAPFQPDLNPCTDTRNFPQEVVTEPPIAGCRKWKDQWKHFEDRWGPSLWGDPEDDPRSSLSRSG